MRPDIFREDNFIMVAMEKPRKTPLPVASTIASMVMELGVYTTSNMWDAAEIALGMHLEIGNFERQVALCGTEATEPELSATQVAPYNHEEWDSGKIVEAEGVFKANTVWIKPKSYCELHEFDLAAPCSLNACPYHTPLASMNCAHDVKDAIGVTPYAVIAHRLSETLDGEDPEALYNSAISKLRQHNKATTDACPPHWDSVNVDGHCCSCGSELDSDTTALGFEEDALNCCTSCDEKYTHDGVVLMHRYRRELKDILTETDNYWWDIRFQAEVLGITISSMRRLLTIAGLTERLDTQPESQKPVNLIRPRPGKPVQMFGSEYLAAEVISSRASLGAFSEDVASMLKGLVRMASQSGISHSTTFA